jgi:hypothetical protein
MDRRQFLATATSGLALTPPAIGGVQAKAEEVTRVHVIFKTHLDVGFTAPASEVIRTYYEQFIPNVLTLTERIRQDGSTDRYIWTTGSWLLYTYLETASPANRARMEQAVQAGDFVWHAIPFTTHTELIEPSLYTLGLEWSARLDRRFGRQTISAKMTDVPGHTRSVIPLLSSAGVRLLHVGVNGSSRPPAVPPVFLWRSPEGSDLMVMYDHEYGGVNILPGGRVAVSVNFTGDNHGPHTPAQIAEIYAGLRKRFPNARVAASNFNVVAQELTGVRSQLPAVTQEIGDTWIHGAGSDPLRMAEFRELSRLRRSWIASGALTANSDADLAFGGRMLRVAEHTWGLDIKTYLKHWDAYDMPAFRAARSQPEFQRVEASWKEKRAYIAEAVGTLPPNLRSEATARVQNLRRVAAAHAGSSAKPDELFETTHFRIGFDPTTGAIRSLRRRGGTRDWAGPDNPLGRFAYQTFSAADFDRFLDQYLTQRPDWALADFGKPGLNKSSAKSATREATLQGFWHAEAEDGERFTSELAVPGAAETGCPRRIQLETFLPSDRPEVILALRCTEKAASRLPEALWFSFVPRISSQVRVEMDKMSQPVSPLDVVRDGNRNLHGINRQLTWREGRDDLQLDSLDAFLVAPGRRTLLVFDNRQPDVSAGMHFCLEDNVWGTNFSMWFEDDMLYRFVVRVPSKS